MDVAAVITRLNEGCENWSFEIVSHEVHDNEAIVLGKLTAEGIVKMAFGGSAITIDRDGQLASLADDFKAAASDALKKAASLLGVGLELYGGQPAHEPERPKTLSTLPLDDRLTTRQLAAIHGASRRRGMTQDGLADLARERVGKSDVARLSRSEASMIISELTGTNGGGH